MRSRSVQFQSCAISSGVIVTPCASCENRRIASPEHVPRVRLQCSTTRIQIVAIHIMRAYRSLVLFLENDGNISIPNVNLHAYDHVVLSSLVCHHRVSCARASRRRNASADSVEWKAICHLISICTPLFASKAR